MGDIAVVLILQANPMLVNMYRERAGRLGFLDEPFNACSNLAFVLATICAIRFLYVNNVRDQVSWTLALLPTLIALGSFAFHTIPNSFTMWGDVIPIAVFQCCMIWEFSRRLLRASRFLSAAIMLAMFAFCAVLFPVHSIMNGSLFYMPNLLLMLGFSVLWAWRMEREPYLLLIGACLFVVAIAARTVDWLVPWSRGTHFLWHMANGAMVYILFRACVMLRKEIILTRKLREQ